jgi:Trk K+ transport system NAD-binding subunit
VFLIYKIATYKKFTHKWESFIEKRLIKSPAFEEATTEDLLHFMEGYGLIKKIINERAPLIGSSLEEGHLREKGVMVLGIERGKNWIPIPQASEIIRAGDHIVLYGHLNILRDLLKEEER